MYLEYVGFRVWIYLLLDKIVVALALNLNSLVTRNSLEFMVDAHSNLYPRNTN